MSGFCVGGPSRAGAPERPGQDCGRRSAFLDGAKEQVPLAIGVGLLLALLLVELVAVLRANGGAFAYTLDDAYIHLALADRVGGGHYGINVSESSAPSSSALWPFLLAPFSSLRRFELVPLALNALAAIATLVVVRRLLRAVLRVADGRVESVASALLLALFVPAANLVGLVFTGMEHSLQLLLSTLLVVGLVELLEGGESTALVEFAAVAGPLVRYEGLALSVAALVVLGTRGRVRAAVRIVLLLGAFLGGFSLFLLGLGLGPLPTSVLAKSPAVATGGSLGAVAQNAAFNLSGERGLVLVALLAALLVASVAARTRTGDRTLAGAAAAAVALHLAFGRNGWFYRYEVYVWGFGLLCVLWLGRAPLSRFLGSGRPAPRLFALAAGGGVFLLLACRPYLGVLRSIPVAARNIFTQHAQMQRFAQEYWRRPVAVNDLGCVA